MDPLGFSPVQLLPGVDAFIRSSPRFKQVRFALAIQQPLEKELAARAALLSRVLRRGSESYPETLMLEQVQAELYGASLDAGVLKIGERHLLSLGITLPAAKYVDDPTLHRRAVALLAEVLLRPVRENGALSDRFVSQERAELIRRLRSLRDNKAAYARWRCVEAMCADEAFGVYSLGTEEAVQAADPVSLADDHRRLLSRHPVAVYAFGDFAQDDIGELLQGGLQWQRESDVASLPPTRVDVAPPTEPRLVEEHLEMGQGWLVMGFRTGVARQHDGFYPMLVFNTLFGGSPHSRLFLNVREKASLAYSAGSSYEAEKGILLATAGIDPNRRKEAETLIRGQLADLAAGNVSEEELDAAKALLRTRLREREDSPAGLILSHLVGRLNDRLESVDEALAQVDRVDSADVAAAAERVALDTVYFLSPRR